MTAKQSEKEIRANTPFELFKVNNKSYKVAVLPINRADAWLALTLEVDDLHTAAQLAEGGSRGERLSARMAFNKALYECVFAYDPDALPREELEDHVSPAAMLDAFTVLRAFTDPFERAQQNQLAEMKEKLGALPPGLMEKAYETGLQRMESSRSRTD